MFAPCSRCLITKFGTPGAGGRAAAACCAAAGPALAAPPAQLVQQRGRGAASFWTWRARQGGQQGGGAQPDQPGACDAQSYPSIHSNPFIAGRCMSTRHQELNPASCSQQHHARVSRSTEAVELPGVMRSLCRGSPALAAGAPPLAQRLGRPTARPQEAVRPKAAAAGTPARPLSASPPAAAAGTRCSLPR